MSSLTTGLLLFLAGVGVEVPVISLGAGLSETSSDQCIVAPISTTAASPSDGFWLRQRGGRTSVPFRLLVAKDGSVAEVRLLPGDYHSGFARETLKTVRAWMFEPPSCGLETGVWLQSVMTFQAPEEVY